LKGEKIEGKAIDRRERLPRDHKIAHLRGQEKGEDQGHRKMLTRAHGIANLHSKEVHHDQGDTEKIILRPVQDLRCRTLERIRSS
jgi:hypothetical protein